MGLWATNCFVPFLSGACSDDEKESERRAFGIRAVPRHQISDPRFYDVIATVRSTPAHPTPSVTLRQTVITTPEAYKRRTVFLHP